MGWLGARRTARAALCLAALSGCDGEGEAPNGSSSVDLLELSEFAEVRADRLDLNLLATQALLGHAGWAREEDEARPVFWIQGTVARLQLPFATTSEKLLTLHARSNPAHGPRTTTFVSLNGKRLARLRLTPEEAEHRLRLPAAAQRPGDNELRLEARVHGGAPRRVLRLSRLRVVPVGEPDFGPAPGPDAEDFCLPQEATLGYALRGEPGAQLRVRARAASGSARLAVRLVHQGGVASLAELDLAEGHAARAGLELPLEPGAFARLELSAADSTVWLEELALSAEPASRPAPLALAGRPHVILFLVDALRADLLGAYGHPAPTSPRFDAFAREAVLFEDAVAQSSWTRPAVASLLTGLGVGAHGIGGLTQLLVPEITTLAEAFGAAGYRTGAFVANGVLSRRLGFDQGFESWNGRHSLDSRASATVVAAALEWLDEHGAAEPFFLYVHTLDPHKPYLPAAEHWAPFRPAGYRGSRKLTTLIQKPRHAPDELRFLRSAYEGEIHQNDASFGAFLDGLTERGLLERSLIVFSSDHGEAFFEHGIHGHGGTLYQEVLHVPLALRLPGEAPRGLRDATPVQHADVAPTLLTLAGLAAPPGLTGRDLSARCLGRDTPQPGPELLLSELSYPPYDKLAARLGELKLIVNREPGRSPEDRFELYDLARDPRESRNLARSQPLALGYLRMQAALRAAVESDLRSRLKAGRETPMTPEQEAQLRALGYLQ